MQTHNSLEAIQQLKKDLIHLSKQTLPVQSRVAILNARKNIDALERSFMEKTEDDRLTALYRVSQSLSFSLNLDDVLTQVMDAVIQLTGAERGFLTLINQETNALDLKAARNIEQETLQQEDMEVSRTVIQSVIDSGQGMITTDAQNDPRFERQESVIMYSLRSIMCVPLRASGAIIGVIYVDNKAHSGLFTKDDIDLLSTFASQAAIAIENARLYTRTDQALAARVAELENLGQIDIALNEELALDRVLATTQKWALTGTDATQCWLYLRDPESQEFYIANSSAAQPLPPEHILQNLAATSTPNIIPAQNAEPVYMVAALLNAQEIIGAIVIGSRTASFSSQAIQFIERFSLRAASAIQNALLYQAVQQANESKSQFVSIVTHELRIPLTSIKGYTDLIRQGAVGPVNEQQHSFLNVIRNNVERMATLISDLSDISRIERGILKLESVPLPLHGYVDETIKSLAHKIAEKSQQVYDEVPEDLPRIMADPNRLVQILTNLLSNAWKYSPENGQISIKAFPGETSIRIEIQDTGIGISTADQEKLFTQFFRSESPAVREQTGWGLGLNVTKKLVHLMGGEIGVTSTLGKGSTFWFTVPIAA